MSCALCGDRDASVTRLVDKKLQSDVCWDCSRLLAARSAAKQVEVVGDDADERERLERAMKGPFPCRECGEMCATPETLAQHSRVVHKEKPSKCSVCDKVYPSLADLREHTRRRHPDHLQTFDERMEARERAQLKSLPVNPVDDAPPSRPDYGDVPGKSDGGSEQPSFYDTVDNPAEIRGPPPVNASFEEQSQWVGLATLHEEPTPTPSVDENDDDHADLDQLASEIQSMSFRNTGGTSSTAALPPPDSPLSTPVVSRRSSRRDLEPPSPTTSASNVLADVSSDEENDGESAKSKVVLRVRAIKDHVGNPKIGELSFRTNEAFTCVEQKTAATWTGLHKGKRGTFPSSFVEQIED